MDCRGKVVGQKTPGRHSTSAAQQFLLPHKVIVDDNMKPLSPYIIHMYLQYIDLSATAIPSSKKKTKSVLWLPWTSAPKVFL